MHSTALWTEKGKPMTEPNCQDCRYRYWLARYDCHIVASDCDHYGDEFCEKMNDPAFVAFMKGENNEAL